MSVKLDTPIRLSDILELQGQSVTEPALKRLRRQIAAREMELGCRLIKRPKPGAPYRTSLTQLKDAMPELFPPTDPGPVHRIFGELRGEVDELREQVGTLDHLVGQLRDELSERRDRDDLILTALEKLKR